MPRVKFTSNLKRFYPDLSPMEIEVDSIPGILSIIDERHPGLRDYIVDEQGRLRQHVNIFIGNDLIKDRDKLTDEVKSDSEVYIMQALSGG